MQFIKTAIDSLAEDYCRGRQIPGFSFLRNIVIKRKPGGDGHIAIYEVRTETIDILHIYHTAMDVERRLRSEFR